MTAIIAVVVGALAFALGALVVGLGARTGRADADRQAAEYRLRLYQLARVAIAGGVPARVVDRLVGDPIDEEPLDPDATALIPPADQPGTGGR
nr:hypothetical protein [Micromonospora sp. DSM 115978]